MLSCYFMTCLTSLFSVPDCRHCYASHGTSNIKPSSSSKHHSWLIGGIDRRLYRRKRDEDRIYIQIGCLFYIQRLLFLVSKCYAGNVWIYRISILTDNRSFFIGTLTTLSLCRQSFKRNTGLNESLEAYMMTCIQQTICMTSHEYKLFSLQLNQDSQ